MKNNRLAAVVCLALLLAVSGCAQSLRGKVTQASDAYDGTLKTLITLQKAGKITPDMHRKIDPVLNAAEAAIDAAAAAAQRDDATGTETSLAALSAAVAQLQSFATQVK